MQTRVDEKRSTAWCLVLQAGGRIDDRHASGIGFRRLGRQLLRDGLRYARKNHYQQEDSKNDQRVRKDIA